jgi:predicted RNase H-like nuclease (RuvC/YqgF family)
MKRFILIFSLISGLSIFALADVTMHQRPPIPPNPVHPIEPERPVDKPVVVRPYVDTAFVDNRVINNTYESCEKYKELIDELNAYIDQLEKEIAELKEKEYARLRKELKEKHEKEVKKFDERKSSIKTKNSIIISDQPSK